MCEPETQDDLAALFNVTRNTIRRTLQGKAWKTLEPLPRDRIRSALAQSGAPMSAKELKVRPELLARLANKGVLERASRGRYRLPAIVTE